MYERPREKLRNRGASYLTTVELIQLIIGSGTARVSAARLAKQVYKQVEAPTYESLIAIPGLGEAKVSQLLAAFELGSRHSQAIGQSGKFPKQQLEAYIQGVQLSRSSMLCIWFDGAHKEIDRKHYKVNRRQQPAVVVRSIFTDALAAAARSLALFVPKPTADLSADAYELGLVGLVKESSAMLHIRVIDIVALHKKAAKSWRAEV